MATAFVFARDLDPEVSIGQIACRTPSGEPALVRNHWESSSHADAIVRALLALVTVATKKSQAIDIVVGDAAVVRMVTDRTRTLGGQAAEIRRLLSTSSGRLTVRYGRAPQVFGHHAELLV